MRGVWRHPVPRPSRVHSRLPWRIEWGLKSLAAAHRLLELLIPDLWVLCSIQPEDVEFEALLRPRFRRDRSKVGRFWKFRRDSYSRWTGASGIETCTNEPGSWRCNQSTKRSTTSILNPSMTVDSAVSPFAKVRSISSTPSRSCMTHTSLLVGSTIQYSLTPCRE